MKQGIRYLLLLITAVSSCKKEDAMGPSPDGRLKEVLAQYQQTLVGAAYGWKGLIFPKGTPHSVFSFYFRFNDSNRVEMFADIDSASSFTLMESSYRLKALQQPSLLFDTYSYVHILCDPDAGNNGGGYGDGLGSDFEFAIDAVAGDTIHLTGRFHGSKAWLVKATKEEAEQMYQHRINREFFRYSRMLTYFKRLYVGTDSYDIQINPSKHTLQLAWKDGGEEKTAMTGYYYTASGIRLHPAINDRVQSIRQLEQISWDSIKRSLHFRINNQEAILAETVHPLILNKNAGKNWWKYVADRKRYWRSYYGFRVKGVRDAYRITTLPNYQTAIYSPRWQSVDGNYYDVQGYLLRSSAGSTYFPYGIVYTEPQFTADGRAVFYWVDTVGRLPDNNAPVVKTAMQMSDPAGYYFVKTGETNYDMVSARDGMAWISWSL